MIDRGEIKYNSREQLRGNWGIAIAATFLVSFLLGLQFNYRSNDVLNFGFISFSINIVSLLFTGVLTTGLCRFLLNIVTKVKRPGFEDLFYYFKIYVKTLGLNLIITIAVGIGTMLFVIPGIIIALTFSQAFYILAKNPEKSIGEVLGQSASMMNGYKMDLFMLELSFIGWWFVGIITLGIGLLWVALYVKVAEINFHLQIANR